MSGPKHKGAQGEILAANWLLSQGYHVHRNMSSGRYGHGGPRAMHRKSGDLPVARNCPLIGSNFVTRFPLILGITVQ
jgi:hypothetical protein